MQPVVLGRAGQGLPLCPLSLDHSGVRLPLRVLQLAARRDRNPSSLGALAIRESALLYAHRAWQTLYLSFTLVPQPPTCERA